LRKRRKRESCFGAMEGGGDPPLREKLSTNLRRKQRLPYKKKGEKSRENRSKGGKKKRLHPWGKKGGGGGLGPFLIKRKAFPKRGKGRGDSGRGKWGERNWTPIEGKEPFIQKHLFSRS